MAIDSENYKNIINEEKGLIDYTKGEESSQHVGKTSTFMSSFNVLCTVIGAGILQLPAALQQSGWLGVFPLVLFAFFSAYTCILISKILTPPSGNRVDTYADSGREAFGKWGYYFVLVFQHVQLVSAGTLFLILSGLNFSFMANNFPEKAGNVQIFGSFEVSDKLGILIIALILWLHIFLKTLHEISIVSLFNFGVAIFLTVVVIVEIFVNPVDTTVKINHDILNSNFLALGGAFSSMIFSYSCHCVVPVVFYEMEKKKQFNMMIICAYVVIVCFYFPIAVIGYWAYGQTTLSPIYDNLCQEQAGIINCSFSERLGKWVAILAVTVHVMLAYALNMNPTEVEIENGLKVEEKKYNVPYRLALRTALVLVTLFVAEIIPNFEDFLDLVSSITSTFTMFIIPIACYFKIFHGKISILEYIWCGFILLFAIPGGSIGTYYSILQILCDVFGFSFSGCTGTSTDSTSSSSSMSSDIFY